MSPPDELPQPLFCDRCQVQLHPGSGRFYLVNIEAMADPTPPVLTEEDLAIDHQQQIAEVVRQLEDVSQQEAMDQVYRRLTIFLCRGCYRLWIENPAGDRKA